ncbi:MAG: hypothetical protein JSS49_21165 [Planctomycetes bacterium]|nr:hypothetical protein [Planctomycetota bacterium]
MEEILRGYHVNEPTWFYLSLLLILAVFFKFGRVWSVRNLDLMLLLSLAPGILLVRAQFSSLGYYFLFAVSGLLLVRLMLDATFTRRPRLEQNLNPAGMAFLCASALLFQTTKIMTEQPDLAAVKTVRGADELLNRQDVSPQETTDPKSETGPAGRLLATPVVRLAGGAEVAAARTMAFLSHVAVILGLIAVGRWHFSDTNLGLSMAALYLLLPCTAYDVSKVNHLLPAALIVWAVAVHRRPMIAGVLLGLACGTVFFPIFLLPIWMAFYWKRGALKFGTALVLTGAVLLGSLILTSADKMSFKQQTLGSIQWSVLKFEAEGGVGFWSLYNPAYRIPVFATFLIMLIALTIWPTRKNLEHLLAHSTAVVVATQFWYPHQGGVYVLWYLPLMLVVTFRPRLNHLPMEEKTPETRVAVSGDGNTRIDVLRGASRTQLFR